MNKLTSIVSGSIAIALFATLVVAPSAQAQYTIYNWSPVASGGNDWNFESATVGEQANWLAVVNGDEFRFVPDSNLDDGESARIANGGTAVISGPSPTIGQLLVQSGQVTIQNSGSLQTAVGSSTQAPGSALIYGSGTMRLQDSASFTVASTLENSGVLDISGPSVTTNVQGNFQNLGRLVADVTSSTTHSAINVGGMGILGGTLEANFTGFSPSYGQSWNLISANSLSGSFLDVQSQTELSAGLRPMVTTSGGNAMLEIGNSLVLNVNRETGSVSIKNVVGDSIALSGYSLTSANGLLSTAWSRLESSGAAGAGWDGMTMPTSNGLAEVNVLSPYSINVGGASDVGLGMALDLGAANSLNEDLIFTYITESGVVQGQVQYVSDYQGAPIPDDLTLFVAPGSGGAASLGNLSTSFIAPSIISYTIRSEDGSLVPANFNGLGDDAEAGTGWTVATGSNSTSVLADLKLGLDEFTPGFGTLLDLGNIFNPSGTRDLVLEYQLTTGEIVTGTVVYGSIPVVPVGLQGDFNGDNVVNLADYTVWRDNLGGAESALNGNGDNTGGSSGVVDAADYQLWKSQFGAAAGAGALTSPATQNVPEPATGVLLVSLVLLGLTQRRAVSRR